MENSAKGFTTYTLIPPIFQQIEERKGHMLDNNYNKVDIDIMVEFSKPVGFQFFELADELENLLQCHVDLVSRNGIKPAYYAEIVNELVDV